MTWLYPLAYSWMPPKLLIRDQELNKIINCIDADYPRNLWIYGGRGLGKSLTLKVFNSYAEDSGRIKPIYIECSELPSETIFKLASKLGIKSKKAESIASVLKHILDGEGVEKIVLIFDDLDRMKYISRDFSPFIHVLCDELDEFRFSLIFSSTLSYSKANEVFSSSALSRLQLKPLYFRPYTKQEVKTLLMQRLNYIDEIDISVDEDALDFICEKVSRIGGDFRKALDFMREALTLGKGKVTLSVVREIWRRMKTEFWVNQIRELPYHQALILACIVETVANHLAKEGLLSIDFSTGDINAKIDPPYLPVAWDEVKKLYLKRCMELGIQPYRSRMMYYALDNLSIKLGYIKKEILPANHELNYLKKKSLFIWLGEKIENLSLAMKQINWYDIW